LDGDLRAHMLDLTAWRKVLKESESLSYLRQTIRSRIARLCTHLNLR